MVRRERNRSVDMFSIRLFRRERNDCVPFHFLYHFLVDPFFRTERFYLKRSRLDATLQRSIFRNNIERSGRIALPCERGLILKLVIVNASQKSVNLHKNLNTPHHSFLSTFQLCAYINYIVIKTEEKFTGCRIQLLFDISYIQLELALARPLTITQANIISPVVLKSISLHNGPFHIQAIFI